MNTRKFVPLAGLLFLLPLMGCSGADQGREDGGPELDGADGADSGPDGSDEAQTEEFALQVPPSTVVCSVGSGMDVLEYHAAKRRVTFKEGRVLLPRDQESFEADLVERLELAPDGAEAQPDGPGVFTRTIQGSASEGSYLYEYRRPYLLDSQPYELVLPFRFEVHGGVAESSVKVIDAETLQKDHQVPWMARTTIGMVCGLELFDIRSRLELELDNGDKLELFLLMWLGCFEGADGCAGGPGYGEVVRAKFVQGQEEREVTDFFDTSFSSIHHLGGLSFLVVLDQPVGSVHALEVTSYVESVNYLDADFQVLSSAEITAERREEW
jgi:hypothetical protein